VTGSTNVHSDVPPETSLPNGTASLKSILCTEELLNRASRPPDYKAENSALVALASALGDSPRAILQKLAEKVLEVLHAGSAGLSLLTKDEKRFYWAAIAGAWQPHIGGGTPRNFGPCGDVLDHNIPMLFTHWERRYPYLNTAIPLAEEGLLVPFYVSGKAVGTIWAIAHDDLRKFDGEDLRLLKSIGRFASVAYQTGTERRLSEGRWKRIFDNSSIGIAVTDLEGRFEMANVAFQQMIGFTDEELVKMTFLDITVPDFRAHNFALVKELLDGKRDQFNFEKQYRRKDGHLIWVRINVSLLPGGGEAPRNVLGIVEDISERKAAEETLQQTQMRLSRAAEVATAAELSASIAHEINQPLSGIVTNASTCLRMLDANPPNLQGARETARRTIRDGNRASEVIARLRALFSNKKTTIEQVNLNEAAREVIALSLNRIQKNRVALRVDLASDLPLVTGNRVQLQQVIVNLLQNGLDAMSTVDDRPRQLVVRTERDEGDRVRLSVQDAGVGFDPKVANRLFETFYTTKSDGMGVGLSVSRSIIQRHQGCLQATPNNGPGATFSFSIPRCQTDLAILDVNPTPAATETQNIVRNQ
jgi:PAS domain S-box-containing protein